MPTPVPLRQRLHAGEAVNVVSGPFNGEIVDFLGQFGLDGIWIECEHGAADWRDIADWSRACDLWGMAALVRVPTAEPWYVTRTLDNGASGIVVPHVNTRVQAERVVAAAKFAPLGARGMYGGRRGYGRDDYLAGANDETLVVVMIEEREAIANLADILAVPDIDVFFVAPADLAQSMGDIGHPEHPDVQAAIDAALAQIVAAGRIAGTIGADATRSRYLDMGVRFFYTGWTGWLAAGAKSLHAHLAWWNEKRA